MVNNDYREMVKQMKKLATKMHNRDTSPRKVTGAPYITHPAKVVQMLKSWGYDPNDMENATTLAIAWGHDLLEDTKVTEEEITEAAELMPSRILSSIRMLSFLPRDGLGEQVVRLAVVEETEPIMAAWEKADEALKVKIRAQVLASYPVQALIAGIDTFTYDNVRVDKNGRLWFVDNGASFNYRACGKKKGWFWDRVDVNDPKSGYLSLAHHPDQHGLRTLLGEVTDDQLWQEARKWKFSRIVSWLPEKWQREGLVAYAKAMDRAVKVMGECV